MVEKKTLAESEIVVKNKFVEEKAVTLVRHMMCGVLVEREGGEVEILRLECDCGELARQGKTSCRA